MAKTALAALQRTTNDTRSKDGSKMEAGNGSVSQTSVCTKQRYLVYKCNSKSLVRSRSNRTPLDSVGGTKLSHEIFLEFELISKKTAL